MEVAKLFQKGQSQVLHIPKEFRFKGDKVFIKKVGNAVVILPAENAWEPLFNSLRKFSDDFMSTREQPQQQKESE